MKKQHLNIKLFFISSLAWLIFSFIFGQYLNAQTFSSEKNRQVAEQILNAILNSVQFDSVYFAKKVYFEANELLTINSPLVLKRKKCKASIVEKGSMLKNKQYVVLGDFTTNWNNPIAVRVQFEILPNKRILNLRLVIKGNKWVIENHHIFDE